MPGDFFLVGINVCYGVTGFFHGGFKKLDGRLKKGEFFRFISGEQVSFVWLVVSASSKHHRPY